MSIDSDADYHLQRAEQERILAEQSDNPAAERVHRQLADLHETRATGGGQVFLLHQSLRMTA